MDYKRLLKSVKPKLNFSFSDIVLEYDIDYVEVKDKLSDSYFRGIVNFTRISGDKKYTVANKVLLTVLHNDIVEIKKYMGDKYFSFTVNEDLDICK